MARNLQIYPDLSDDQDYLFNGISLNIPESYSLEVKCPVIRDQGTIPVSTVCAALDTLSVCEASLTGNAPILHSILYTYDRARTQIAGWGLVNRGCYLRDVFKAIQHNKVLPEASLEFKSDTNVAVNVDQINAASDKSQWWYVKLSNGPDMAFRSKHQLDDICRIIAHGYPCAITFRTFSGWQTLDAGVMISPNNQSEGYHSMMIVGYNRATQRFRVRNSFGADWGAGGYAWMPFSYWTGGYICDIWTMINGANYDSRKLTIIRPDVERINKINTIKTIMTNILASDRSFNRLNFESYYNEQIESYANNQDARNFLYNMMSYTRNLMG
jgi:hypothetical protein